jgi:sortase system peptidoglycan-associated protein
MKKLFIATSIALSLNAAFAPLANAGTYSIDPEQKKEEKTNEAIGFGTGAIAGAAVGGPVGALVGGIFGILIADDVNDTNQLEQSQLSLAQAKQSVAEQQQNILALQTNISKMQHQQMAQLASYNDVSTDTWLNELANFETNLQFKTASFLVEDVYASQLSSLASILSSYPQLKVKVTGYADNRGDSEYNKSLSVQRAQSVKEYLLSKNVKASQINVFGEGETTIATKDTTLEEGNTKSNRENLVFARKVNITLVKPNQQMTAAN